MTIDATVSAPGVLVLADAYHPDWSVTVDGKPDKLWPVNLALRGCRCRLVPTDRNAISRSGAAAGMLLSLIGLFGGVVAFTATAHAKIARRFMYNRVYR